MELQSKKEEIENSYYRTRLWLFFSIVLGVLLFFFWRLSVRQRIMVKNQSMISESLRQSIGQIAHLSKDTIGTIAVDYQKDTVARQKPSNQLTKLQTFMTVINENNGMRITQQKIDDEVLTALLFIQSNYYDFYGSMQDNEIIEIKDGLGGVIVPIYTILNIINNSFKHSIRESGVRLVIEKVLEKDNFIRIKIQDFAKKASTVKKENGSGENYIKDMLSLFNGRKVKPDFTSDFNETGYYVEFQIVKK